MNARRNHDRRRAWRPLLAGTVIAAGAVAGVGSRASAATVATFASGVLTVVGDGADNTIVFSRNAAGAILVNNGAIAVVGGSPTVANTTRLVTVANGGNDTVALNEANGALPPATVVRGQRQRRRHRRIGCRHAAGPDRQRHPARSRRPRPSLRWQRQ